METKNEVATGTAVVRNKAGIHCRPTAVIVKEARRFDDDIVIEADTGAGDPKSAIELLALGLDKDTEVAIRAEGPTASACVQKLVELFGTDFDFPPRKENGDSDSLLS